MYVLRLQKINLLFKTLKVSEMQQTLHDIIIYPKHTDIKQISNFVFRNVNGLYTDNIPYLIICNPMSF